MEIPYMYLQGFQGITSFLEEEYYDVVTYDLENGTEDDWRRSLLIYGFISVLALFILLSFLAACYYHFKHLSTRSSDSSEHETTDERSNIEQSIETDNTSRSEGNISNESLYDANTVGASCSQECMPKSTNVKIRDSTQFIKESSYFKRLFSGERSSPFSRQNASNASSRYSKMCPSKTFSSCDNSKENLLECAQNLNLHAACGINDTSSASGGPCKYHNLPLTGGGTSKLSVNEYCGISLEKDSDSQSSTSDMHISALFLSNEDISTSTLISELEPILTDVDSETVTLKKSL